MSEYTEAQIATVKELLAEAKEIGDVMGEYSFTSRLKDLEETKDEFVVKLDGSFKKKLKAAFFEGKYYDNDMLRGSQSPEEYFEEWYERKIL